jgi:hypothetical protein
MDNYYEFQVDNNIIKDLIHSQNGTISTAIKELVMNGIDAGSKDLNIIISKNYFEIKDSGKGFKDKEEIMKFFKTFGTPHEKGDAEFGRFRIGRGQIMAFAKSSWHSKSFIMTTDINSGNQGFNLTEDADYVDGCIVSGDLYTPLKDHELKSAIDDLRKYVKLADCNITINNSQVKNENIKWDYEDDLVKINYDPKGSYGLNLYSKGILVKELHQYTYGLSADIVTKDALELNMARNEINDNDPIWQHVHTVLRKELRKRKTKNKNFTEFERMALIDQFVSGEMSFIEIMKLPLLSDSRGKKSSIGTKLGKKHSWSYTTDENKQVADSLNVQQSSFVLLESELNIWGVNTIGSLIMLFQNSFYELDYDQQYSYQYYIRKIESVLVLEFDDLKKNINTSYVHLNQKDLTKLQKAQRNALQYMSNTMAKRLSSIRDDEVNKRKIVIGKSDTTLAWTDSQSFIAFRKDLLKYFDSGLSGLAYLTNIMLHEYTHLSGSVSDNNHDFNFYEQFHDSILVGSLKNEVIGNSINSLQTEYRNQIEKSGLPFPKWMDTGYKENELILNLSSKRANKLLKFAMELYGIEGKEKNNQFILSIPKKSYYDIHRIVSKNLNAKVKTKFKNYKEEIESKTGHIRDYDDKKLMTDKLYLEYLKNYISDLSITENVCDISNIIYALTDYNHRDSEFGGLRNLTRSKEFGVISLERKIIKPTNVMAGKDFEFSIQLADDGYYGSYKTSALELENGGKGSRLDYVQDRIKKIVDSIKDGSERSELIEKLFNSETQKILK